MKRHSFLASILTAAATITLPLHVFSRTLMRKIGGGGFLVRAGKDRADKPNHPFIGDTFTTKVSGTDTDGAMYMFESERVAEGGPGVHLHYDQDETWYVLEGEFNIKVGDTIHHVQKGDTVFGPRMIPHAFEKLGKDPARLLMIFQPAGKMEDMFLKLSQGATRNMTEAELMQFRQEHGIKQLGPPLHQVKPS